MGRVHGENSASMQGFDALHHGEKTMQLLRRKLVFLKKAISCSKVRYESVVGMTGTKTASAHLKTFSESVEIVGGQSRMITS